MKRCSELRETGGPSVCLRLILRTVTVRLARVFDVELDALSKRPATYFSFETDDGRRHLSVRLPGRPRLQAGDTVTAVLTDVENWQTLHGWKNLSNGEVIVRGDVSLTGTLMLTAACGVAVMRWQHATTADGRLVWGIMAASGALVAAALALQQWRATRTRRLLTRQL